MHQSKAFLVSLYFLLTTFAYPHAPSCPHHPNNQQNNLIAQTVIANFAQIAISFIQMMGSHDRQTLIAGGCSIITSIANIAQTAVRKAREENIPDDQLAEVIYQELIDSNVHTILSTQIKKAALRQSQQDGITD